MKLAKCFRLAAIGALVAPVGLADTIITFTEDETAVRVFVDGTKLRTVQGESADTTNLTDPGFFKGPLGRRLCLGCPQGIFGAALFEQGTSEISDLIIAEVTAGLVPPEVDTDIFFASDPDISALANKFNKGQQLLTALTTKAAKTFETGGEQTLSFYDLNGVLTPLPSGRAIPFFFTGGTITVKAKSDIDVPEPASLILFGTVTVLLGVIFRGAVVAPSSRQHYQAGTE